jgi:hypothetical protein
MFTFECTHLNPPIQKNQIPTMFLIFRIQFKPRNTNPWLVFGISIICAEFRKTKFRRRLVFSYPVMDTEIPIVHHSLHSSERFALINSIGLINSQHKYNQKTLHVIIDWLWSWAASVPRNAGPTSYRRPVLFIQLVIKECAVKTNQFDNSGVFQCSDQGLGTRHNMNTQPPHLHITRPRPIWSLIKSGNVLECSQLFPDRRCSLTHKQSAHGSAWSALRATGERVSTLLQRILQWHSEF